MMRTKTKIILLCTFLLIIFTFFVSVTVQALTSYERCDEEKEKRGEYAYRRCMINDNYMEGIRLTNEGEYDKSSQILEEVLLYIDESLPYAKTSEEKKNIELFRELLQGFLAIDYAGVGDYEKAFYFTDILLENAKTDQKREQFAWSGVYLAIEAKDCEHYDKYNAIYWEMARKRGETNQPLPKQREKVCGEKPEDKKEKVTVSGRVVDWLSSPVPYISVTIDSGEEKKQVFTDKEGKFSVELKGDAEQKWKARLDFIATLKNEELFYFIDIRQGGEEPIWIEFPFDPKSKPLDIDIDFSADELKKKGLTYKDLSSNVSEAVSERYAYIISTNLGLNYTGFTEAFNFAFETLKVDRGVLLANGPIKVFLLNQPGEEVGEGTHFVLSNNTPIVRMDVEAMNYFQSFDKYIPYHEFSHFLMEMVYPEGIPQEPDSKNHNGFINNTTTDSFVEGFANFMALVIKKSLGEEEPYIFGPFGSMEVNWKPWDGNGRREEFAVTGVLWDLYDGVDPSEKDNLQVPLSKLWEVLSFPAQDFTEFHGYMIDEMTKEDIKKHEAIFVLHGFYRDETVGDGEYDLGEPYEDANNNGYYDEGETFYDLAGEDGVPVFDGDETVGPAAHYQRKPRRDPPRLDRMVVTVPRDGVYLVSVIFAAPYEHQSYTLKTYGENGVVYVELPPRAYEGSIRVEGEDRPQEQTTFTIAEGYAKWDSGAPVLAVIKAKQDYKMLIFVVLGVMATAVVTMVLAAVLINRKKRQVSA